MACGRVRTRHESSAHGVKESEICTDSTQIGSDVAARPASGEHALNNGKGEIFISQRGVCDTYKIDSVMQGGRWSGIEHEAKGDYARHSLQRG
jgi:hypothetical protein